MQNQIHTVDSENVTIIKPIEGWRMLNLKELWAYRELLWVMTMRDIKVRYKQTVLGVAWAIIQPVITMLIFTFIFGRLAKIPSDGIPYPVFVFSGLLAWNFFSAAVATGGASLVGASSLISKVYFPRLIIPLASIGVTIIDFMIACIILLILMFFYSVSISVQFLLLPVFFFGLLVTTIGLSTWLSAVTVTYRDFRFVIPFMLQIWMYLTPVIYPVSFIPEKWRWLIYLNPLLGWINGLRAAFLGHPIDWFAVAVSAVFASVILLLGIRYFEKAERRFADVI